MNSEILFLFDIIFLGGYLWIHFHTATWLLLTLFKKNIALETPLVDKPRKYKYRPDSMYNGMFCFFYQS